MEQGDRCVRFVVGIEQGYTSGVAVPPGTRGVISIQT